MELSQPLPLRRSKRLLMKRQKLLESEASAFTKTNDDMKSWSDLPTDLLEQIVDRLALLELLSFRVVCKHWRLGASNASAIIESATGEEPWLLLYGNDLHCSLYNPSSKKVYTIYIPELEGAECIASCGGWLLLYRTGSLSFFCPSSRTKVDLPKIPREDVHQIATFSSPPSSPDCIVCVGGKTSSTQVELYVLRRGANEWVKYKHVFDTEDVMQVVTCATLCDGSLYFLDSKNIALTFSLEDEKFYVYQIVSRNVPKCLPFASRKTSFNDKVKQKLGLKNSDSVSICGTQIQSNYFNICIHNEEIWAEEGKELRRNKGVWFEPKFFKLPPNQSWLL